MNPPVETSTIKTPSPEDGIAERLRGLRERFGLSQTQFHQRTKASDTDGKGISRTVLIGYESGKFKPGARELRILCQAFAVTPGWLLLGEDAPAENLDGLHASLFSGMGPPTLRDVFRLALSLATLKPHEREAIGTLVHGLGSARRGAATVEALSSLADSMALDAELRLTELTQDHEAAVRLRSFKGKNLIEHFDELYERTHRARWRETKKSKL